MRYDYNKKDIYSAEISELINEVMRRCNECRIPMFAAFGTKMEDGKFRVGDGLECTVLLPEVLEIKHNDACFAGFVKIVNGAEALYPEEKPIEVDSFNDVMDEDDEKAFGRL